jgi:SAP domain
MESMTSQYSAVASQASDATERAAEFWTQGVGKLADRLPALLPQIDLVPAIERYFDFVQRTVTMNRSIAVEWAQAVGALSGAARERAESASEAVRERAESAGEVVRERAESFERAASEQAEKAEKAQEELAREARRIERQNAREAHEKARARYEGLTKAELSDLLAKRDLPKTGNVDELVERLVEADGK